MRDLAPDTRGFLEDIILLGETPTEKAKARAKEKGKGSERAKEKNLEKEKAKAVDLPAWFASKRPLQLKPTIITCLWL
jgi:hypothetical protein